MGLRTLEPGDPDYWPRYEGSPVERDGAYHQGTVWPWLLGPFVDAYLAAFGATETTLAYCRGLIEGLEAESSKGGCLGSIAEVYDGDEPRRAGVVRHRPGASRRSSACEPGTVGLAAIRTPPLCNLIT